MEGHGKKVSLFMGGLGWRIVIGKGEEEIMGVSALHHILLITLDHGRDVHIL